MNHPRLAAALLTTMALCAAPPTWAQKVQGVSNDEILVGTLQDLSGPIATYGKDVRNGMMMRVAEVNERGLHGRKLKLLIEDAAYDPKRAALAAQKLVTQDQVFIMAANLGVAVNQAAIPTLEGANVINFFPMGSSHSLYEPANKYRWSFLVPYFDAMKDITPRLYKDRKATRACAIYQDDDYGLEVLRGTEAGLKTIGVEMVERTSFKRGATDFSSQVARMKGAGCDFVAMATGPRESVGTINEARKLDFNPVWLGGSSTYNAVLPALGGKTADGIYAPMNQQMPYEDSDSPALRAFYKKYRTTFNEAPSVQSLFGYYIIDALARAIDKTGPNLTTDTLARTIETMVFPADGFGSPELKYTATNHIGSNKSSLSQLQNGRWKVVMP